MRRCTGAAWSSPEEFWAEAAGELEWFAPWTKVLETGRMGPAWGEVVCGREAESFA